MTFGFEAFDLRLSEAHEGLSLFTNFHTFEFLPFFLFYFSCKKLVAANHAYYFVLFDLYGTTYFPLKFPNCLRNQRSNPLLLSFQKQSTQQ